MTHSTTAVEFAFGRCVIQPAARRVLIDGQPAVIGARAFDVLLALVERRERVVTKNELLDLVWPGVVVEENNLQVHVSALRKLFGPAVISTIPGRGYRFTAALDGVAEERAALAPPAALPSQLERPPAPGNLPRHFPPIFGRDDDLRVLVGLIETHPLVTVVGAAGIGKTTLAIAAAHALRERWSGGAWKVELAPVTASAQLPHAVAQALQIALSGMGSPQDQLVGVLQSQTLLLVLDNCEHVIEAAGALAEAIAARAPSVRLVATSQELLNVPHEQLFKLNPLAVPAADEPPSAERFGAIRLFVERAQAADPHFTLSTTNEAAVAEICRRLDGLPLAIELAAARVRLLGVQGVQKRLGERFRVLTGGARTALRRHQTLRAAIDWSYALLSSEEQAVLRRLGVFVGGFTLELAQQVVSDERIDEWAVLDALGALVDKSLVAAEDAEPPRYRLLETTRAYALEKLADAGETAQLLERHGGAVCRLFVQTEEARFGEEGTLSMDAFMQRLAPELGNLRAALDWAMDDASELATAVALAGASAEVARTLRLSQEALRVVEALQERVEERVDPERAALFWSGVALLGGGGRLPKAKVIDAGARAERIYRQRGSRRRLHRILCVTMWDFQMLGECARAEAMLPEILALEDAAWPAWMRSQRVTPHAWICMRQERFEDALQLLTEQRTLLERESGEETLLVRCLSNLCLCLLGLRRDEETVALARLALEHSRLERTQNDGYYQWHLTASLTFLGRLDEADQTMRKAMADWRRDGLLLYFGGVLALLLAEKGRYADAVRVDSAAMAFLERSGVAPYPLLKRSRGQLQQRFAAALLEPADIERWRREGGRLDETAIEAICLGGGA
jgi:predicted ATPase/DNA-binding winged helix-turn-helix (wHTH) protein